MARIRTRPIPWPDKFEKSNYKDLRRGAADDAFWDEDELVDYHSGKKNKKKKKRTPCPVTGRGHVYVWDTTIVEYPDYGWGRYSYEVTTFMCCGCRHRHPRKRPKYKKI